MKVINKYAIALLLIAVFCFGFASASKAATAPTLSDVANFAVLGGAGITNTGSSILYGNLGRYPGSAITGFLGTAENDGPGVFTGYAVHQGDATAHAAQTAATTAYSSMASQSPVALF